MIKKICPHGKELTRVVVNGKEDFIGNETYEYIIRKEQDIKELKELLTKYAKTTHKCKELHDWYCDSSVGEGEI